MNRGKRNKRPMHLILDIIIGVLCVITVGITIFTVNYLNEEMNYSFDEESFYYRFQDEDFGQMVEMYHQNEAAEVKADKVLKQYYGVAEYYEAASYYKAYKETGDHKQADKYFERMKEAETKMGELRFACEMICEKLQIE